MLTYSRRVHKYDTRTDILRTGVHVDIFRVHQHRTILYEQLPSQVGVTIINHLPCSRGVRKFKITDFVAELFKFMKNFDITLCYCIIMTGIT